MAKVFMMTTDSIQIKNEDSFNKIVNTLFREEK